MSRKKLIANCHPGRPHHARGLCNPCYDKEVRPNIDQYPKIKKSVRKLDIYGEGSVRGKPHFIILNNPEDDLKIGHAYKRGDFLFALACETWPDGLKVKDNKGMVFTVKLREGQRPIMINGKGEVFIIHVHNDVQVRLKKIRVLNPT